MVFNDDLMYVQIFKSSLDQLSIQTVGHSPPVEGSDKVFKEDVEAKQGNCLIGYTLNSCLIFEDLVDCNFFQFIFFRPVQ